MNIRKSSEINLEDMSSVQLEALARRATRLAKVQKSQEPTAQIALDAGIESFVIEIPPGVETVGYRGQIEFNHRGKKWLATGHSGRVEEGSYFGNSYIELQQLSELKSCT